MSAKLDQSLDELTKGARRNHPRRVRPRRSAAAKVAAPAGGVSKKASTKANNKTATTAAVAAAAASFAPKNAAKVIISGFPVDVDEKQIQDFISKTVGPIKRLTCNYGPSGSRTGVANVEFRRHGDAEQAVKKLKDVKIDQRPLRIDLVISAAALNAVPVKDLAQRITDNAKSAPATAKKGKVGAKSQPKSAAATTKGAGKQSGAGAGAAKANKRAPRPKKKTAEELDAEMTDYFGAGSAPATNGTTNGVSNGGDSMEVS